MFFHNLFNDIITPIFAILKTNTYNIMSVIQSIRDRGAWIIFAIIALALIAFILQDGMGRRGGGFFSNTTSLGKVNGVTIDREAFDKKVAQYAQQGQDKSSLIPQLWNMEVDQILLKQECEKLGITVTAKELGDAIFSAQGPLAQYPQFKDENGNFKEAEARQAVAQLKKSKGAAELQQAEQFAEQVVAPTEQRLLGTKYYYLLQKSAYVPTWLLEKTKADNSTIANVSYVYVPYTAINDSTIKVTDDEVAAYVKKHPKGFEKKEETRVFSYVTFDATASKSDSNTVYNELLNYKNDFKAATDAKAYLGRVGTDMPYLDGYVLKSSMKMPFADSIKALADGQTFGPYLDAKSYVIAKMVAKRSIADSVFCMHILVKTGQGGVSDSIAKKRIDSVEAVIKGGADFKTVMKAVSDDKAATSQENGVMKFASSQIQDAKSFDQDFAKFILLDGKAGEKKVVHTQFGYHYIYITEQKNIGEAVKVAYLAKSIAPSSETNDAANNAAMQFASSVKNKKQFDEAAAKLNKTVMLTQEVKAEDFTIANFGRDDVRSLVRWLYEKDIDDISTPTEVNEKYIVGIITNINKKGLENVASAKPKCENFIRNEKKAKQIIETKFKGSSLEDFAKSSETTIQRADSVSFENSAIGVIGFDLKATGAAFNKNSVGKVSNAIAGNSGVFALKTEVIGAKPATTNDEAIKQRLLQMASGALNRFTEVLREGASIKDNRAKFY